VPKAGTTALHAALVQHPQLFLSRVKEPKFFLTDGPPPGQGGPGDVQTYGEHVWRRADYEALFADAPPGTLRGEATPFYLYDLDAQARIRRLLPDAKLIVLLRNPVDRAHSNWSHLWARPEDLPQARPVTVLAGDAGHAVKDPVLLHHADRWHLWASVHPLDLPEHTDRMTTDYATSVDGVRWQWHGTALVGRPGEWDQRGVRVSSVALSGDRLTATYDGRASAEENWEERTGTARGSLQPDGTFGSLLADDGPPTGSPDGRGLRYVSGVELPAGQRRVYYEVTRSDGAHELCTEVARTVA
jgi:hypothetical protein